MFSRRRIHALMAQNAREVAEHDRNGDDWSALAQLRASIENLPPEKATRFEELTRKCYVLIHAANKASVEHRCRWAWLWTQKANELFDIRNSLTIEQAESELDPVIAVKDHFAGHLFKAIVWCLFGPDSHSLVRYFDHGQVPQWAKESKWTRKGK
jgi:hypothetical protein